MSKNEEKTNPNEEPKKSIVHDEVEDDFYLTQVIGVPISPYQRRGKGGIF